MIQSRGRPSDKDFSRVKLILIRSLLRCLMMFLIAWEAPRYLYAASGWSRATSCSHTNYVPANKLQLVLKV